MIDVGMLGVGGTLPMPGRPLSSALIRCGGEMIRVVPPHREGMPILRQDHPEGSSPRSRTDNGYLHGFTSGGGVAADFLPIRFSVPASNRSMFGLCFQMASRPRRRFRPMIGTG